MELEKPGTVQRLRVTLFVLLCFQRSTQSFFTQWRQIFQGFFLSSIFSAACLVLSPICQISVCNSTITVKNHALYSSAWKTTTIFTCCFTWLWRCFRDSARGSDVIKLSWEPSSNEFGSFPWAPYTTFS